MPIVVSVQPLQDYHLEVLFDDGTGGIIPLKDRLFGPMFEPLRDIAFFRQVSVDQYGVVCWPNGADLAPDAMYEQLRSTSLVL
jgi:hypothetical protein